MGFSSSILEDNSAESNVHYGRPAQEVSKGTMLATQPGDSPVKFWQSLASYSPCPKNLSEAKFKINELISSQGEMKIT